MDFVSDRARIPPRDFPFTIVVVVPNLRIRGGVSIPMRHRKRYTFKEVGRPTPTDESIARLRGSAGGSVAIRTPPFPIKSLNYPVRSVEARFLWANRPPEPSVSERARAGAISCSRSNA